MLPIDHYLSHLSVTFPIIRETSSITLYYRASEKKPPNGHQVAYN